MITKQKTITIETAEGKINFIQNKWSPMKCFSHLPKIGKAFAVPMSMMASGTEENFGEVLPTALFMLFEQMEEQDIWELFTLIVQDVFAENGTRPINLNEDCGDDLGAVLTVVAEALQGNYGSLFTGNGLSNLMGTMTGMGQVAQTK